MKEIKKLEQLLQEGKITRREFMRGMAALGVTAAVSPMLMPKSASASTPKKGGRFRVGYNVGHTDDTFDPRIMVDRATFFPGWAMRNNLIEIDYKGNAIPELAESWETSADFKTWVFDLRKGVEFTNGKSFDAEDVVFTMNLHRGETKSAAMSLLKPVTDIKADGKYRVIFTLSGGNIDFPFVLTDYHFPICPAGTKGREFDQCIGTGGFILKSWEPGVRLFAVRNPNYWKEGRGHFDELEIIPIQDRSSRTTALKTGRVDYMNDCEVKTVHMLEKDPKLQVLTVTSGSHFTFPMRQDMKPYDNIDLRLAFKYGIDRELIVTNILNGYGKMGNDHPIGPNLKYYANELPQRKYDADKARYHIKKSGLADRTFDLSTMAKRGIDSSALILKEGAAKAGIKINVNTKPSDGYWSNVWMKDAFCTSWWNGRPTTDTMFTAAWAEESNWCESFWKHKKFNQLLKDGRKEKDEGKRRAIYVEMQRICVDEGPSLVPCFLDHVMAATKKIKFKNLAGNFEDDGHRAAERWWFES